MADTYISIDYGYDDLFAEIWGKNDLSIMEQDILPTFFLKSKNASVQLVHTDYYYTYYAEPQPSTARSITYINGILIEDWSE